MRHPAAQNPQIGIEPNSNMAMIQNGSAVSNPASDNPATTPKTQSVAMSAIL